MYLFIDTETTGLPRNWNAPPTDFEKWPRLVQLAWILCTDDGRELQAKSFIIKPDGFSIPINASNIHGISNDRAIKEGSSLDFVLEEFATVVDSSSFLIAHNMSFDENVLRAELYRRNVADIFSRVSKVCTKEIATPYCKLPGKYGSYKWPTLQELHVTLFGVKYEGEHDVETDVRVCAKCFLELKRRGVTMI